MMEKLKEQAIALLKEDFDPELDYELKLEQTFETHPLRDPGLSVIFSFQPFQDKADRFFLVTGNVLPMIYPDYGLTIEEIWATNIGTEYYIKRGVNEDTEKNFSKLLTYVKMVATVFQEQLYITLAGPPRVEKVFVLGDQKHVVGKATYEGKVYSWIVGDIPHFVYKKDLPPQIIWSLHMGRILLT